MDWLAILGILCLGLMIGTLVGYYINQPEPFSLQALYGSVSVLAGSGVMGVFNMTSPGGSTREYWFYPIGLVVGFFAAPFLDRAYDRLYENGKSKRR